MGHAFCISARHNVLHVDLRNYAYTDGNRERYRYKIIQKKAKKQAKEENNTQHMEEEFGDFLFSVINAARLYDINPDKALKRCNNKFKSRFGHIEDRAFESGKPFSELTLEEMSAYWNEAKAIERGKM